MTGFELETLKDKEEKGTITKKELRRLKAHRAAGGKRAATYGEKHGKIYQD